jgi:hypothetical protein
MKGNDYNITCLAQKALGGRSLDMIIYGGSFGGVWEEWPEMGQGYCNRLLE